MTRVLTVRVPTVLLDQADARAADLGLDRGKYVRSLIEEDIKAGAVRRRGRFASEEFIGSTPLGAGPYTNRRVKAILSERRRAGREEDR
jgi:hypothetical protein